MKPFTPEELDRATDWRRIPGPWQGEPDRDEWRHLGFPCLAQRNTQTGAWCGYVAVPPGHPWHGQSYNALDDAGVGAHGGLTYSDACNGQICHAPAPGEPDNVWWAGFDCGHAFDLMPIQRALEQLPPLQKIPVFGIYRDLRYVRAVTERLAAQAMDAAR